MCWMFIAKTIACLKFEGSTQLSLFGKYRLDGEEVFIIAPETISYRIVPTTNNVLPVS